MSEIATLVRYAVFLVFAAAVAAAVGSWLVRTRRVSPFTRLGRSLKALSDLVLKPVEARLFRAGGNPAQAGWWLVIAVAVIGVVSISLLGWLADVASHLRGTARGGPRAVLRSLVLIAYQVLFFALLARVILSWFGVGRYNRWLRPAYWLTDWLVEPIRRVLPPFGMFDLSPIAALFALWVIQRLVLGVL